MGKWIWRILLVALIGAAIYYVPRLNALTAVEIEAVEGHDYEQQITVVFNDCTRDHDVVVEETSSRVTLTARTEWMGLLMCTSRTAEEVVTLNAPLQNRELMDGHTRSPIELQEP